MNIKELAKQIIDWVNKCDWVDGHSGTMLWIERKASRERVVVGYNAHWIYDDEDQWFDVPESLDLGYLTYIDDVEVHTKYRINTKNWTIGEQALKCAEIIARLVEDWPEVEFEWRSPLEGDLPF